MKVVKPGTPLPAGIREKLESLPPSTDRGGSVRPGSISPEKPGTKSGTVRPGSISPEKPGTRSGSLTSSLPGRPPTVRPSAPPAVRSAALDEVERALSALNGRHPDAERVEREVRAEREWRQRQVEEEAKRARKMRRIRRVAQVVLGALAIVAGGYGYSAYQARTANESAIDARAQLYTAKGFVPWVAPKWPKGSSLEADVDTATCAVAVGTSDLPGSLEITRGADVTKAQKFAAFCACPGDHVKVLSSDPNAAMVRLLRIEPRAVGGQVGLSFLDPRASVVLPAGRGPSCTPGALESWLNEGHGPTTTTVTLDKVTGGPALAALGFSILGSATRSEPMLLVRGGAERCVLVVSSAEEDPLALRLGGADPVQMLGSGRVAWCSARTQIATIAHGTAGDLVAYEVPAASIGGSLGLVEWNTRLRVSPTFKGKTTPASGAAPAMSDWPFVAPDDLAWDALLALRASGAPEAKITGGSSIAQFVADPRLASLATLPDGDVQPADGAAIYGCTPLSTNPRSVCSEAGPTTWILGGAANHAAVAQSAMPFWISALNGDDEAGAQDAAANMLAFARRMHAMGFAPTTLDHLVEMETGVEVTGRSGEDEIVAVAIGTVPPYVIPYTDAVAWNLENDPRIIPLGADRHVHLMPLSGADIPKTKRRTVVFRHAISLAPTQVIQK